MCELKLKNNQDIWKYLLDSPTVESFRSYPRSPARFMVRSVLVASCPSEQVSSLFVVKNHRFFPNPLHRSYVVHARALKYCWSTPWSDVLISPSNAHAKSACLGGQSESGIYTFSSVDTSDIFANDNFLMSPNFPGFLWEKGGKDWKDIKLVKSAVNLSMPNKRRMSTLISWRSFGRVFSFDWFQIDTKTYFKGEEIR